MITVLQSIDAIESAAEREDRLDTWRKRRERIRQAYFSLAKPAKTEDVVWIDVEVDGIRVGAYRVDEAIDESYQIGDIEIAAALMRSRPLMAVVRDPRGCALWGFGNVLELYRGGELLVSTIDDRCVVAGKLADLYYRGPRRVPEWFWFRATPYRALILSKVEAELAPAQEGA